MAVYLSRARDDDLRHANVADDSSPDDAAPEEPADTDESRSGRIGKPAATIGGPDGQLSEGERLYINNCQACHLQGQGMDPGFPALVDNSAVDGPDATNLIQVILNGAQNAQTRHSPAILTMPDFGWRLNDTQVATLASYVRSTFGGLDHEAASVAQGRVEDIRARGGDDD